MAKTANKTKVPKPKAKRHLKNRPSWVPAHHHNLWDKPWTMDPDGRKQRDFKKLLWDHGYLTPNFTRAEAASKPSANSPLTQVPESLRAGAQQHCVLLEKARHDLGDKPMSWLDMYRTPAHNSDVGGVSGSQHLNAKASDWGKQGTKQKKFDAVLKKYFGSGGIGISAVNGRVCHVDNGPGPRRWTYPFA